MTEPLISFWGHMEELRKTLLSALAIIALASLLCFAFCDSIIHFFVKPSLACCQPTQNPAGEIISNPGSSPITIHLSGKALTLHPGSYIRLGAFGNEGLILLSPLEGMGVAMKASALAGIVISSPFWIWMLLKFIFPGLKKEEKRVLITFIGLSLAFLGTGILVSYQITIPMANRYLYQFNQMFGSNLWSMKEYLDFTLTLMFGTAISFELCLTLLLLLYFRIFPIEKLKEWRRVWIVTAFILGAILTPPDVPSQLMVAIPLIVFYELILLYSVLLPKIRLLHSNVQ